MTTEKSKKSINYKIVPLKTEYFAQASDVLMDAFLNRSEPLNMGSPIQFRSKMTAFMLNASTKTQASCVAVEYDTNKVLAVLLCYDYYLISNLPSDCVPKISALFEILILILYGVYLFMFKKHLYIIYTVLILWISMLFVWYLDIMDISNQTNGYYLFLGLLSITIITVYILIKIKPTIKNEYNPMAKLSILMELKQEFEKKRKENNEIQQGVTLEAQNVAVHTDYQRQGIVTALIKYMINIAKRDGYKYIVAEATSDYSQQLFLNVGFKNKKTIYYKKWKYPKTTNKYPYSWVADKTGFQKICLMVCYL